MTIKYLLLLFAVLTFTADNYPKISGRVNDCRVDFNYTSEVEMVDDKPNRVINTISNNGQEAFCISWKHGDIFCDNREPCIITAVGKVPVSLPYAIPKSLIRIGTALRCSTYVSCYVDKKDLIANLNKQVSEITCYNANGETSMVTAIGQYFDEFKTSTLEINISSKTGFLIKLPSSFRFDSSQKDIYAKVTRSSYPDELLNRYERKEFNAVNDWIDTAAKFNGGTVYYLIDNNSEHSSKFKFASGNLNDASLTKVPTVMITPSQKQFIGFAANIFQAK